MFNASELQEQNENLLHYKLSLRDKLTRAYFKLALQEIL